MSDRDRKLVWTAGVVTLLAVGFFIGRMFGGDGGKKAPIPVNEIVDRTDGSASVETEPRIPIETETGDGDRLVSTSTGPENGDSVQDAKPTGPGGRPPYGARSNVKTPPPSPIVRNPLN